SAAGLLASQGSLELSHDTITQNHVGSPYGTAGGINFSGYVVLRTSIVAGNYRGSDESNISGTFYSPLSQFNLIGSGGSGGLTNGVNGNIVGVTNPGLAALDYYGGPTRTHALLQGSLAIDAGDPEIADQIFADQRGEARIAD